MNPQLEAIADEVDRQIEKDAARYRWLRSRDPGSLTFIGVRGPGGISMFNGAHADGIIDAEMAEPSPPITE